MAKYTMNRIKMHFIQLFGGILFIMFSLSVSATGFSLFLKGGMLYGPGNLGTHHLQNGTIRNFIVTDQLSGEVDLFNNGTDLPNILAETLHVTEIDGVLSDGTLINENVDAGFVLEIIEPDSMEPVKLLVCSISAEIIKPDKNGNLNFSLTAGFDPGLAEFVVTMPVTFATGIATIPLSEKTRLGKKGGLDAAGPYNSGYTKVGKLGDFDNDGMLDGEFILAGHAPLQLIIAEGNPILVVRPFTSDIPVGAADASIYTLKGIYENYPQVLREAINKKNYSRLNEYIVDINTRLSSLQEVFKRIRISKRQLSIQVPEKNNFMHNKRAMLIAELNKAVNMLGNIMKLLKLRDYTQMYDQLGNFYSKLKKISVLIQNV